MDPDELSVIHVAGTKGKGSTCAIVGLADGGPSCHTCSGENTDNPRAPLRAPGLPPSAG